MYPFSMPISFELPRRIAKKTTKSAFHFAHVFPIANGAIDHFPIVVKSFSRHATFFCFKSTLQSGFARKVQEMIGFSKKKYSN